MPLSINRTLGVVGMILAIVALIIGLVQAGVSQWIPQLQYTYKLGSAPLVMLQTATWVKVILALGATVFGIFGVIKAPRVAGAGWALGIGSAILLVTLGSLAMGAIFSGGGI